MLTLFSSPKPFAGLIGEIQRIAIDGWVRLDSAIHVVIVGDEAGVGDAAAAAGMTNVEAVERSEHGTPRIDDASSRVARIAEHERMCFVNAHIVLLDHFIPAVEASAEIGAYFLVVGQNFDLHSVEAVDLSTMDARAELRRRAIREGAQRGAAALDFFVFPAGLFDPMPPFSVGRAAFDNWVIWKARQFGPVIDAIDAVVAIHQSDGYDHLARGKDEAY